MKYRDYALGARIKAAMKIAGYKTAKTFCEEHDIPYLTFSQHVQGRRKPTHEFLEKYSQLFSIPKQWLLTGETTDLDNEKYTEQLLTLASENLDRSKSMSGDSQLTHDIDNTLLTDILALMLKNKYSIEENKAHRLSKAASFIYSDIMQTNEDTDTRLKMVKPAVMAFLRHIDS